MIAEGVGQLCTAEVNSRRLPPSAADRIRNALTGQDENVSEAERLAAKQAVAAALRRRAASTEWAVLPTDRDDAVVPGLARAYAVACGLASRLGY